MLVAMTSGPSPNRNATAASPPLASSLPPGRPVRMSDRMASPLPPALATAMAAEPERTEPMVSTAPTEDGSASAAWMAVALVLSR